MAANRHDKTAEQRWLSRRRIGLAGVASLFVAGGVTSGGGSARAATGRNRGYGAVEAADYFDRAGVGPGDDVSGPLQMAVDAAIRENAVLILPSPGPNSYLLSRTIHIRPNRAFGNATNFSIRAAGSFASFKWVGANGTARGHAAMFRSVGWKRASISDLQVRLRADARYVVAFDIDIAPEFESSGVLTWTNCHVSTDGAVTGCVGWRLGHTGQARVRVSEESCMTWTGCTVEWARGARASQGWVNEHVNGLNHTWINCSAAWCDRGWSTTPTSGAGDARGGAGMHLFGCGSSYCGEVFRFTCGGQYVISGGRHELCRRLLTVQGNGDGLLAIGVLMQGLLVSDPTPIPSGTIRVQNSVGVITLRDSYIQSAKSKPLGDRFLVLSCAPLAEGNVIIDGVSIGAPGRIYSKERGDWKVSIRSAARMTVGGVAGADGPGFWSRNFSDGVA